MNKTIITGNLTQDPGLRIVNTANGQATVCDFSVAVNRVVRNQKSTEFFRVSCWNKQADNATKYLKKGSKVLVSGRISARAYIANDGSARANLELFAEEIEYLSGRRDSETDQAQSQPQTDADGFIHVPDGASDEELPFA